jgi:hypothetical protein
MENQILLATVRKKTKHAIFDDTVHLSHYLSFDRDKLKEKIEKTYKLKLEKKEEDDYPYFTDGGFYYKAENEDWTFEIYAFYHNII